MHWIVARLRSAVENNRSVPYTETLRIAHALDVPIYVLSMTGSAPKRFARDSDATKTPIGEESASAENETKGRRAEVRPLDIEKSY